MTHHLTDTRSSLVQSPFPVSQPAASNESPTDRPQTVRDYVVRSVARSAQIWASLFALGVCLQVVLVCISWLHPAIELATHFSMHALVTAILSMPVLVAFRRKRLAFWLAMATCYLALLTKPWSLLPVSRANSVAHTAYPHSIDVLCWNVLSVNQSFGEIEQVVRDVDPDVLILIEVRPGLMENLPYITKNYPDALTFPSWGGEGIGIFSRIDDIEFAREDFSLSRQPAIIAKIPNHDSGAYVQLVALHTLSPIPVHRTLARNRQFASFLAWSEAQHAPICVCGDFNTTPWTGPFEQLVRSGFRDSRGGVGNCASWPASAGMFGIPIDHALTRGDCAISERRVLPNGAGSDHRPIAFKLHY